MDTADIVIALFDSRLGQATPAAVSGTAEEIQRAIDSGKFVHVWFSNEPVKHDVDLDELKAVREYRKILEQSALVGEYTSPADLALKVRSAIEHDLTEMALGSPAVRAAVQEHAMPRASCDNYGHRLVVENLSRTVRAEQLTLDIQQGAYRIDYYGEPIDLLPAAWAHWPVSLTNASPRQINVAMRWLENGEPQEDTQPVFLRLSSTAGGKTILGAPST